MRGLNQTNDTPLLEVRGVSMNFGGVVVLTDMSLALNEGDLRCIIGPNGCGKTTLFNVITGAFPPTAGRVSLGGRDITGRSPHTIARLGVSRKFQVPGIYPELTVAENLEVPLASGSGGGAIATLLHRQQRSRIDELLELCRLADQREALVSTLAHGERQWLEIAMLVATDARLLLLDEPTAGMSILEKEGTAQLIRQLREDLGKTVLVIEHDMSFVQLLDCPVVVMLDGAVLLQGDFEEIRQDRRVIGAYLGEAAETC